LLLGTNAGEREEPFRTIAVLCAAAVVILAIRAAPTFQDELDSAVVVTLLCFLVACMTSSFLRQSFDAALGALLFASVFLLSRRYLSDDDSRRLFIDAMAILGTALAIAVGILWLSVWLVWLSAAHYRLAPPLDLYLPAGIYGYRHYLAILLVLLSPAMVSFVRHGRWVLLRRVVILGLCLTAFDVFAAGSRNIWLSALAAAVIAFAPRIPRKRLRLQYLGGRTPLVVAGVIILVLAVIGGQFLPRLLNIQTLAARSELWTASFQLFLTKPLSGFGPGSYPFLLQLTDYYQYNSYSPPNPDSAVLQLLAEAGLAGVLGVLALGVAFVRAAWKGHRFDSRPVFAVSFFLLAALATGPTDYGYLVLPTVLWAAFALPADARARGPTHLSRGRHWSVRLATVATGVVVLMATASTLVASIAFESARSSWRAGDRLHAMAGLDLAITADPGMAFYWRTRGELRLAGGEAADAGTDLRTASRINAADTLALRSLALAYSAQGQFDAAQAAADRAVAMQRSDVDNVVLDAYTSARSGDTAKAAARVVEALQQDPLLIGDDHWGLIVGDGDIKFLLESAANTYGTDAGSTVRATFGGAWLGSLTGNPRLTPVVQDETPPALLEIATSVSNGGFCDPTSVLDAVRDASPAALSGTYWQVRAIFQGIAGESRSESAILGSLQAPGLRELIDEELPPKALLQAISQTDLGGYGRVRLAIPQGPYLPTTLHASNLWLTNPRLVLQRLSSLGIQPCNAASKARRAEVPDSKLSDQWLRWQPRDEAVGN
jgi:O-antigen ligase